MLFPRQVYPCFLSTKIVCTHLTVRQPVLRLGLHRNGAKGILLNSFNLFGVKAGATSFFFLLLLLLFFFFSLLSSYLLLLILWMMMLSCTCWDSPPWYALDLFLLVLWWFWAHRGWALYVSTLLSGICKQTRPFTSILGVSWNFESKIKRYQKLRRFCLSLCLPIAYCFFLSVCGCCCR